MSVTIVLFWLLITAVIVFAAALVLPFAVKIEAIGDGARFRVRVGVQPFGRLGPMLRFSKPRAGAKTDRPSTRPSAKRSRYIHRIPQAGLRLLSDLIRLVRIRKISVDARFGCGDPADTGQIFGLLSPLLYGASGLQRTELRVEPVFEQATLSGRAALELSFVPITLLVPALRFGVAVFGPSR